MLKNKQQQKTIFHIMNAQASNQVTQTQVINYVLQTNDYAVFKHAGGNRAVNKLHVSRLKQSFQKEYLLSPIIVNQQMQIIDGQHRFEAAKDLGLPIRYFICNDYGLPQIQTLNANASNWKKSDYLNAYCDLGYDQYLLFRKFMERYPDFTLAACEIILNGATTYTMVGKNKKLVDTKSGGYVRRDFEEGIFEIKDYAAACILTDMLIDIKPYFKSYNQRIFIIAMGTTFKNPNYSHQRMLRKIRQYPTLLQVGTSIAETKKIIEDLYNYRTSDKVSLRFF